VACRFKVGTGGLNGPRVTTLDDLPPKSMTGI